MNILIYAVNWNKESGGPYQSISNLMRGLSRDFKIYLVSVGKPEDLDTSPSCEYYISERDSPISRMISLSLICRVCLLLKKGKIDFIILNENWTFNLYIISLFARLFSIPYSISPRGTLMKNPMLEKRLFKKIIWFFFFKRTFHLAKFIHVTSVEEGRDLSLILQNVKIVDIPNFIVLPPPHEAILDVKVKSFVYVGRIHTEKGLLTLLEAWKMFTSKEYDWTLHIYGPDSSFKSELKDFIASEKLERIIIGDAIWSSEKNRIIRSASYFINSSPSENFGVAILESLMLGTPVICTKGAPWSVLEREGCGWWVDHSADSLCLAMQEASKITLKKYKQISMHSKLIGKEFSPEIHLQSWMENIVK